MYDQLDRVVFRLELSETLRSLRPLRPTAEPPDLRLRGPGVPTSRSRRGSLSGATLPAIPSVAFDMAATLLAQYASDADARARESEDHARRVDRVEQRRALHQQRVVAERRATESLRQLEISRVLVEGLERQEGLGAESRPIPGRSESSEQRERRELSELQREMGSSPSPPRAAPPAVLAPLGDAPAIPHRPPIIPPKVPAAPSGMD